MASGRLMGGEGLVNMCDWYDTQSVLFVVVGVTAHILKKKRLALGLTGSTLIPIKRILTCKYFCLSEGCFFFFLNEYKWK